VSGGCSLGCRVAAVPLRSPGTVSDRFPPGRHLFAELRMEHGASVVIYISQIVVLLIAGRVAGESMQRIGQPPVIGQIIAGIVVGPSVLGIIAPGLYHNLFPNSAEQKAMLDAVAQLGILLLLLMTGMETDLSVFRDVRRPVISISLTGIVVPFICGVALGMLLPDSILPSAAKRLITALFLGTALSISSVKIVAMVVRDLGFLRRAPPAGPLRGRRASAGRGRQGRAGQDAGGALAPRRASDAQAAPPRRARPEVAIPGTNFGVVGAMAAGVM